jgi:hypothetical protein
MAKPARELTGEVQKQFFAADLVCRATGPPAKCYSGNRRWYQRRSAHGGAGRGVSARMGSTMRRMLFGRFLLATCVIALCAPSARARNERRGALRPLTLRLTSPNPAPPLPGTSAIRGNWLVRSLLRSDRPHRASQVVPCPSSRPILSPSPIGPWATDRHSRGHATPVTRSSWAHTLATPIRWREEGIAPGRW